MGVIATRTERVVLELDASSFTTGMARAAAAAALLHAELDGLNTNIRGLGGDAAAQASHLSDEMDRLSSSTAEVNPNVVTADQNISRLGKTADNSGKSIDQLSGRLGLLADAAIILGPALIPLGSQGLQAVGGLTGAVTSAAIAGGSAVVAFQGLGDAVKAIDAYQLDPTVANLEKAQKAMAKIGPQAQRFVKEFQAFQPVLTDIQRAAAKGWFPGLSDSLDDFAKLGPRIEKIFEHAGRAGGDIVEQTAESLSSRRWRPFLDFLDREVPSTMRSLARAMGDIGHGLSEMFITLDPSNDRFLGWVERVANGFDNWARSSEGRDDIQAFMDYARQNGPEVEAFFLSLVDATTQIVQAAAPLGGPTLTVLTKVLEVVAKIADSDIGTPFITALVGLRAYSRMLAVVQAQQAALARTTGAGAAGAGGGPAPASGSRLGNIAKNIGPQIGVVVATLAAENAASANDEFVASAERMQDIIDRADFSNFTTGLDETKTEFEALTDRYNVANKNFGERFLSAFDPGRAKNYFEGLFGDTDVEEAAKEYERLEAESKNAAKSVGEMGRALGMTVGPIDGSARSTEQLNRVVDKLQPKMDKLGITTEDLAAARKAQHGILGQMTGLTPYDDLIDNLRDVSKETRTAISFTQDFSRALQGAQTFLSRNEAIDATYASLNALKQSIKDNGTAFDKFSEKGQANRAALRAFGSNIGTTAEKLHGLARVNFVNNMRRQFLEMADKLGLSQQQTDRWMDQLGILHKMKVIPTIDANHTPLDVAIAASKALLESLKDKTVTVRIQTINDIRAGGDAVPGGPRGGAYAGMDPDVVPKADLDTTNFDKKKKHVQDGVGELNRSKATPHTDMDDGPFRKKKGGVERGLHQIDLSKATPTIDIFAGRFFAGLSDVRSQLASLPASKTVTITTILQTIRRGGDAVPGARGGSYADGGFTGLGGKYEPAGLVHRGEVVIPQELVKRDWSMLTQRYGHLPGFADGGRVGGLSYSLRAEGADTDETKKHRDETKKDREETEKHRKATERHRHEVEKTEKALAKERDQRQNMLSYRSEVGSSLAGELTGGGLAQFDTGLSANRNDARAMLKALREASKKGLDGPLMNLIAASGDLALAQDFANLGRKAIAKRERQYGSTVQAQNALGNFAVGEKFGETLAQNAATIARLEKQLKHLRHDVREGARQGTREGAGKGKRDRDRETHHRTRTRR